MDVRRSDDERWLYHDHCFLQIYGHGTGMVLSFIRMIAVLGTVLELYSPLYRFDMVQCTFPKSVGTVQE